VAYIKDPNDTPRHAKELLGGAQAQIVTGRATLFRDFQANQDRAAGFVTTTDDGDGVTGGKVIVLLRTEPAKEPVYQEGDVHNGEFFIRLEQSQWRTAQAYYVSAPGFADCWSDEVPWQ